MVKRNTSYDNSLDVTIPLMLLCSKSRLMVLVFAPGDSLITYINGERKARKLEHNDIRTPLALVSPNIDLVYDKNNEIRIETNIFPDLGKKEAQEKVEELNKKLLELKTSKDTITDPAKMEQLKQNIDQVQKQLNAYSKNEHLIQANEITNRKSRMRYIAKVRRTILVIVLIR